MPGNFAPGPRLAGPAPGNIPGGNFAPDPRSTGPAPGNIPGGNFAPGPAVAGPAPGNIPGGNFAPGPAVAGPAPGNIPGGNFAPGPCGRRARARETSPAGTSPQDPRSPGRHLQTSPAETSPRGPAFAGRREPSRRRRESRRTCRPQGAQAPRRRRRRRADGREGLPRRARRRRSARRPRRFPAARCRNRSLRSRSRAGGVSGDPLRRLRSTASSWDSCSCIGLPGSSGRHKFRCSAGRSQCPLGQAEPPGGPDSRPWTSAGWAYDRLDMDVLAVIHGDEARSGIFGPAAAARGHAIEEWSIGSGSPPSRPLDHDGAVIVRRRCTPTRTTGRVAILHGGLGRHTSLRTRSRRPARAVAARVMAGVGELTVRHIHTDRPRRPSAGEDTDGTRSTRDGAR